MRSIKPLRLLIAATLALTLVGCDNYAVVLGGGWPPPGTGAEGSLGQEAFLPADGAWIKSAKPTVEKTAPSGVGVHAKSPIVIRFSETIAEDTLQNAFSVVPEGGFGAVPVSTQLIGDGRILVLLPTVDWVASTKYTVSIDDDAEITDLTGQALVTKGTLTTFTAAATNPVTPKIVMNWPEDGLAGMSAIGELVTVFDRPMNPTSFDQASFAVTVNGTPPVFDPDPTALTLLSGFFPVLDTRVWTWASTNPNGLRQNLGAGATVQLSLSPSTNTLKDMTGNALLTTVIDFDTALMTVPTDAALGTEGMVASPPDAVGIANLTAGNPKALTVTVDIPGSLAGDIVGLYMFGSTFDANGDPAQTIAFERTVTLSADADTATFMLSDLNLVATSSPLKARFADGTLTFAFQVRRNGLVTPVRNLDADATLNGIQDVLLDTQAPELIELFGDDGTGLVVSDQRGLSLAGMASERLRAAEITTALGDNGTEALVFGAQADGSFLTAPVTGVDVISPASQPVAFTLTIYDQALNPATVATTGTFVQKGVVGPTALAPGGTLAVEVFDAIDKTPIAGARAFVHADDGLTFPIISNSTTLASGLTTVTAPLSGGFILTILADGYDIISLMDPESTRVSVPLTPTLTLPGAVGGALSSNSEISQLTLPSLTLRYGDPRSMPGTVGLSAGGVCTSNPFGDNALACPFGPIGVLPGRLGAVTALAGNFDLPSGSFSAGASLQSFALALPLAPLEGAQAQTASFEVGLLSEPGVDVLDLPTELPLVVINAAGIAGLDLGSLEDDPATRGEPLVTGETLIAGLPGSVPVAQGLSYDQTGGVWNARIAAPGAVLVGGALDGVVDADLFVHAALQDTNGARSSRRARVSDLGALATPNQLDLVDAPTVLAPSGMAGGVGYDIVFDNVISDAEATHGIVGAEVVDSAGRVWRLYSRDPGDGAPARVHVVDFGAFGTGPAAGLTVARAFAVGGAGLDWANFLWSDLERTFEIATIGEPAVYTTP